MSIKKLNSSAYIQKTDVADKINEIIDVVNSARLCTCRQAASDTDNRFAKRTGLEVADQISACEEGRVTQR